MNRRKKPFNPLSTKTHDMPLHLIKLQWHRLIQKQSIPGGTGQAIPSYMQWSHDHHSGP